VTFCWGLDKQYPQLGTHELFIASDFRQSLNHIFQDLTLPDEPNFYVHAPVRVDPSLAPEGQDTLTVVVPVGHIDDAAPQDWSAIQKRALRPRNRHARYRNLYFVGASTHPGTGLPTVLISARLATERILEDAGVD